MATAPTSPGKNQTENGVIERALDAFSDLPVLRLEANPFLSRNDPTDGLMVHLAPLGSVTGTDFEAVVDALLDMDPNASGFMRKPVRTVFFSYPSDQWARAVATCPKIGLDEYRAVRFYTENYYREINGALRAGFRWPSPESGTMEVLSGCQWRFLRLVWWIHQAVQKLARVQPALGIVYRWHKLTRWRHWIPGQIFESGAFMSATGPEPNVEKARYGEYFGRLLLVIDLEMMPKGEAAEISACSKFEAEREILMLPWLRFRVTSIRDFDDDQQSKWQAVQAVHLAYAGSRFDMLDPAEHTMGGDLAKTGHASLA